MTYSNWKPIRNAMHGLKPGQTISADLGTQEAARKAVKTLAYHARKHTAGGKVYRAVCRGTSAYVVREA